MCYSSHFYLNYCISTVKDVYSNFMKQFSYGCKVAISFVDIHPYDENFSEKKQFCSFGLASERVTDLPFVRPLRGRNKSLSVSSTVRLMPVPTLCICLSDLNGGRRVGHFLLLCSHQQKLLCCSTRIQQRDLYCLDWFDINRFFLFSNFMIVQSLQGTR